MSKCHLYCLYYYLWFCWLLCVPVQLALGFDEHFYLLSIGSHPVTSQEFVTWVRLERCKRDKTWSYSSSQRSSSRANIHLSTFSIITFLLAASSFALDIFSSIAVRRSTWSISPDQCWFKLSHEWMNEYIEDKACSSTLQKGYS